MSKNLLKHLNYILIGILFSLCFIILIKTYTGNYGKIYGNGDMEMYGVIQKKIIYPNLFEKFIYFNEIFKYWPKYIHQIIAQTIKITNNIKFTYYTINIFLFVIFWIGNYFLSYYLFKKKLISVIYSILSSYSIPSLFGTTWGITLGILSIRDFVTFLFPWLLFFYLKNHNNFKKMIFLCFLLGLLTNIHLISGSSIITIFLISYFLIKGVNIKSIKENIIFSLVFFLGAIPYILNGIKVKFFYIPLSLFQFRFGYQYSFNITIIFFSFLIPLLLFFFAYKKKKISENDKNLFKVFIATTIFVFITIVTSFIIPIVAPFQYMRSNKFLIPLLYLYLSYTVFYFINKKTITRKLIGVLLFVFLLIPPYIYFNQITTTQDIIWDFRLKEVKEKDIILNSISQIHSFNNMNEVSEWINKNTQINTKIIVSPLYSHTIRAYSNRAVSPSYKEGGGLILLRSSLSTGWYEEILFLYQLFQTNETELYVEYANKTESNLILLENKANKINLPIIYKNPDFTLYAVPK